MVASNTGALLGAAIFTFRQRGKSGAPFYKVTLSDVVVSDVRQAAGVGEQYPLSFNALESGADSAGFLDEVALKCTKIEWEYRSFDAAGKPAAVVRGGWDFVANKKV
jgi:type VI protein secretion system component Hcp